MKVLIANRGEIGLRVVRACRDAGVPSVAVYADQDRDAPFVRAADEAYALGGATAAATYLDHEKLLTVAARAGANAVHPGYGFLAENVGFARAVLAAGLTWIGPPPEAMDALADKVSARRVAQRVGAPLLPGTADPVPDAEAVAAFARTYGLPVAIKAVLGGGGRGMRVARRPEEIPELFGAATREAAAAFGDGACYVERYLDRPRHVETQCLADSFGQVVVVSTRDCTLQRRHQKLVEEAPAPFLTEDQEATLVKASVAILTEVGYVGAGTCEFLLGSDGSIAFLEVNTRLQVEHCVTEEVTGLDLVREQLRIAAGEALGYDSVRLRGHAMEFRINAEDPAKDFLPVPGRITTWLPPSGPGVRLDSGVEAGSEVSGAFDSLLAKLVISGADRAAVLARARRALAEFEVEGIATVLPFHRAVLDDAAFAPADVAEPFAVHTRWIETDFVPRPAPPERAPAPDSRGSSARSGGADTEPGQSPGARERVVVEVDGRRLEVVFPYGVPSATPPAGDSSFEGAIGSRPGSGVGDRARPSGGSALGRPRRGRAPADRRPTRAGGSTGNAVTAPMQGTVVRVEVAEGQVVAEGETILVLEAMKMEQPLMAPRAGRVTNLNAAPGAILSSGATVCELTPLP